MKSILSVSRQIACGAANLALACLLVSCSSGPGLPKDAELRTAFPGRKAALEKLVEWIQTDGLDRDKLHGLGSRLATDAQKTGLSRERLNEYRTLMRTADVVWVGQDFGQPDMPGALVFYCGRYEDFRAAQNKGYAYLPEPPVLNPGNHVVQQDNLDKMDVATQYTAYSPLEGNWYLYYQGGD